MKGIEHFFPAGVSACLGLIDDVHGDVFPEEFALVSSAVPERNREFLAGRILCRRALAELGIPVRAILMEADRRPAWPPGVVGSISHSRSTCGVVVARRDPIVGLGLDIEERGGLPESIWPQVLTPREVSNLMKAPPVERGRLALLVFSAKESVYKCLSAAFRGWLDFTAVEIEFALEQNRFCAVHVAEMEETRRTSIARIIGRFTLQPGRVITAASLSTTGESYLRLVEDEPPK